MTGLARTALFAVGYVVAAFLGRTTVLDDSTLSLVWPAAGIAVLWFCARRDQPHRWVDVLALAGATIGVNLATGASWAVATVFVAANVLQVVVFTHLFVRSVGYLWGLGGTGRFGGRLGELWALLAAASVSSVVGAAVGSLGLWVVTGHFSWSSAGVWLARNTSSIVLVVAVGLRVGYAVAHRRTTLPAARATIGAAPGWRVVEYVAIVAASVLAYLIGFTLFEGLPLAFPLLGVTVWAALRLPTTAVVLHDAVGGTAAVVFTLQGHGPFAAIESLGPRALVAQLFVGMVAVVGLILAVGRDERAALMRDLEAGRTTANRQADLMAAIIDSMNDGLSVVDAGGHVALRNPAASVLFGGQLPNNGTVADAGYYGIFHPDGTLMAEPELPYARALAGEPVLGMDMLVRNPGVPDGRILRASATTLPADLHGVRRAVVLFHDVTAERRQRDELASFAGVVAHDLLNPLMAIDGWTGVVADTLHEPPEHPAIEDAQQGLIRVQRAAARMRNLINDLLAYTTSRDAAITAAPVALAEVVGDIVTARSDAAAANGDPVPRFHVADLPDLHADPVLVRQLLDNLIGNAVKYTAPGVVPEITVKAEPAGTDVRLEIADNGIGIPPGQHDAIFDNFHRAHHSAGYSGSGLGLAICKRIVERHGGTIHAADNPGGGSVFTVTLPAAEVTADREPVLFRTNGTFVQ